MMWFKIYYLAELIIIIIVFIMIVVSINVQYFAYQEK